MPGMAESLMRRAWNRLTTRGGTTALSQASFGRNPYGGFGLGLMQGGIVNHQSGMGLQGDKSEHSFFTPTRVFWRGELEVLYAQSWAMRKFIDIPIDDMTIKWREFEGDGQGDAGVDKMKDAEMRHGVKKRLKRAMKAGRVFGTSLMVIVTREDMLDQPLVPERVRAGDLRALPVFDRFSASAWRRDEDPTSPTYGETLTYRLNPTRGVGFLVDASRVLRFDGITPLTDDGFTLYDRDWGISDCVPAILAIMQDQTVATAAAHLSQEASIPVLNIDGLREALSGGQLDPGDASAEMIGEQLNQFKSIYRLLLLDKTEDFERVPVNFSGLHEIMDRVHRRLAAAAGIPATRFLGQSPIGLNATGESDMANYAMHVAAMQVDMMTDPLRRLDMVLARDAGLQKPPDYSWVPLTDMTDMQAAEAAHKRAEALAIAIDKGIMDEDEAREALDGSPVFGALLGEAPGLPEPELPPMPGLPGGPPSGA